MIHDTATTRAGAGLRGVRVHRLHHHSSGREFQPCVRRSGGECLRSLDGACGIAGAGHPSRDRPPGPRKPDPRARKYLARLAARHIGSRRPHHLRPTNGHGRHVGRLCPDLSRTPVRRRRGFAQRLEGNRRRNPPARPSRVHQACHPRSGGSGAPRSRDLWGVL